jgi:hypothetical protein
MYTELNGYRCCGLSWVYFSSPLWYKGSIQTGSWARQISRQMLDVNWNVMAHAQKTDFVFRRNGQVHLNRRGASVQSTTGSPGVRIRVSNAGYTMFRGSVKSTGYQLHSPVSPSLSLPYVTVCHHISTGVYRGLCFFCTVHCGKVV